MGRVHITDYIENPDIEAEVLGDELASSLHNKVEVLLVWHQKVDQKYIDSLPNLKGIVRYGVGVDNLDVDYANSKGIYVCNTPDYGTEEVSDTAIGMILNIARGISRYDYQCRDYRDNWQENVIRPIQRTSQQVLGVMGAGRIGGSVVLRANALRFQTVIFDPYKNRGHEKLLGTQRVESVEDLLGMADIVSFHAPLTEETRGIVNEDFLEKMKCGASFVNTSRGGIVKNMDIFYSPLKEGTLSNVALDVLPEEPPTDSELIRAWRNREPWLDGKLIINPHAAYYSCQSYVEMREKAVLNAQRILKNELPFNIVGK